MWLRIGDTYLNLDHVIDAHFVTDADGTPTATAEMVSGTAKHYTGREAQALRDALDALSNGSTGISEP